MNLDRHNRMNIAEGIAGQTGLCFDRLSRIVNRNGVDG